VVVVDELDGTVLEEESSGTVELVCASGNVVTVSRPLSGDSTFSPPATQDAARSDETRRRGAARRIAASVGIDLQ
jgi:hypothetical protein